jgi:hypothetical protein
LSIELCFATPFYPPTRPILTMALEYTPQNFALRNVGTKQYVATKITDPYM